MIVWYMSFIACDISVFESLIRSTCEEFRFIPSMTLFQNHLASLFVISVHTSPSRPALAVRPARWTYTLAVGGES